MLEYLADNGYNFDGTTGSEYGYGVIAKALASTNCWLNSTSWGTVGNTAYPKIRNKSGFTAMPSGYRRNDGSFSGLGYSCGFWSITEYSIFQAWYYYIGYNYQQAYEEEEDKEIGNSVRCVKD